jgi:hypothetical protein
MPVQSNDILRDLSAQTSKAVAHYWTTRTGQSDRQRKAGKADQGLRSAVTGGAQMDGFITLFTNLIASVGIPEQYVFTKTTELPGFFRPTKEWICLSCAKQLRQRLRPSPKSPIPAITSTTERKRRREARSICGQPIAKALPCQPSAFPGLLFMLEDCANSNRPIKAPEPRRFRSCRRFIYASFEFFAGSWFWSVTNLGGVYLVHSGRRIDGRFDTCPRSIC